MLFLLSPAKTLDYETPPRPLPHTDPSYVDRAERLIAVLRRKSARQVAALMDLSEKLATLNVERYRAWTPAHHERNARQAILAFNGDVYDGLQASTLTDKDLAWAQDHVCILSGLYGLLRPLDRMQPYRLEMGTGLVVGKARNLYQYWGPTIADALNARLEGDKAPVVVNLASQEYFRSVDLDRLRARVVECVFEDWKGGQFKVISFFAKKARGLMARYAIRHRVRTPVALEAFDLEGYGFAPDASTPERLVFRRTMQP
ncbi:peroxide stress protein YaaA [Ramlibacter sp. MMS24-I3-19]|uniref:peroxide stress protein YaaA n=1 Tax=Ramlibacter sp. MMS24-I3-19 TaxID=3416606 RepID=UPI003D023825